MRLLRWGAFVAAVLLAGASMAQIAPLRMPRPAAVQVQPVPAQPLQAQQAGDLIYQSPEAMKAAIDRLRREKRELRTQLQTTLADLQDVRTRMDEMTRAGGSLVTAQCASETLSRNTAGAEENCAASGYNCSPVSGLCHRQCNVSTECAPGFLCDVSVRRCVPPPTGD